jgi:Family of unknown function (DUF5681)
MPFEKGQSGNPGGRPKVVAEVKELARAHTGEAIETLVSIMTNTKSAPAARVSSLMAKGLLGYNLESVTRPLIGVWNNGRARKM